MADTTKIYENIFIKKNAAGDREYIKVPYAILADPPKIPDVSGLMPKSGGTFTGEVKFGSTENFQGYYIKRMIGSLGIGTRYADLASSYKDGTWHRMWRLRFPSGSSFWGKIKITLYGGYSSFNASGVMSKSITCNFNTSSIYNNVGCYDGLGVNVEQDFRISEAIWNSTASAWEVLIWQKNLSGNNSPTIMLECWTANNTNYINAFNGITAQPVELTQSTSYSAQKASPTGGTKTVEWATLPVYENPLGEEIATVAMLPAAANNGKLTIQKNGTDVATFTANQSSSVTANITVPTTASDVDALSLDGGTIKKSKTIKMDASANSDGANLKWGTVNSKNPYIGYASDQVDGTFVVGSLLGTNYASGLAIGGGSGNLLWKGTKVATTSDIPNVSGKANLSGGNTFDSQQIFEDITGTTTINGSYVTIQPTGAQGAYSFEALNSNNTTAFSINGDSSGRIKVGSPVELGNGFGTSGQVLTSQGAGETPTWTTPAIKSVSLSGTTLTITL